jgi:hypothetical protein
VEITGLFVELAVDQSLTIGPTCAASSWSYPPQQATQRGLLAPAASPVPENRKAEKRSLLQTAAQGARALYRCENPARQVPLYCFRLVKCGTFMPLSVFCNEFRIAVVWTLFGSVFSASSSVHRSLLFNHVVVCCQSIVASSVATTAAARHWRLGAR